MSPPPQPSSPSSLPPLCQSLSHVLQPPPSSSPVKVRITHIIFDMDGLLLDVEGFSPASSPPKAFLEEREDMLQNIFPTSAGAAGGSWPPPAMLEFLHAAALDLD